LYTVKEVSDFPSIWPGIIKLFPARESLVSDIPAEDRKITNLFYSVCEVMAVQLVVGTTIFWLFTIALQMIQNRGKEEILPNIV
jgi:hypothetical protein